MPLSYATDIKTKTNKNFLLLKRYFYPEKRPASSYSIERKVSAILF